MHWKNHRGFSLVELAVVLVVAGMILAIGAPAMIRYLNGYKVRNTAHKLADEMRMARQRAVANNTINWVYTQWGPNATQYWTGVQTQNGPGGTWGSTQWTGPLDLPDQMKQVSANFNSVQYVFFKPNGLASSAGSVRVCSPNASVRDTSTINVDFSGSVW